MDALLARVRGLLQGETVRVITYGAVVVVWFVTHVGYWLGLLHNQPPALDAILAVVSAALVAVNEAIRMFVYSPTTVAIIQAGAAAAGAAAAGAPGQSTVATTTAPAIATTAVVTPPSSESVTPTPDDPDPLASQPAQDVEVSHVR